MKTKVGLINNIKLTPVFMKDEKSDDYKVHYQGFPKAYGTGKTEQEAELNLLQIFIVILTEKTEKIREQSLNNYYTG